MAFLKHIGKTGDRKVAIIFRQIPGDEHMCLVIYPDLLPSHLHDPLMKVLESPIGQTAEELADALSRNLFPDGRNMLQVLHSERMMKRVQTDQVLITPTPTSNVKLSELNKILNEMKQGEDAVRKLAEIDAAAGLVDPALKRKNEAAYKATVAAQAAQQQKPVTGYGEATDGALDDKALAANMLAQATRMHNEATSLISEAARMRKEAERLFPGVKMMEVPSTPESTPTAPKTRGRKKAAVVDAAK